MFAKLGTNRVFLAIVFCAASLLGHAFYDVADAQAQDRESDTQTKRCSMAELERSLREPFAKCPGSFAPFSPSKKTEKEPGQLEIEAAQKSGGITNAPPVQCDHEAVGDYPHLSSGDVSAHGWWSATDLAECPDVALVRMWLKGYWCDGAGCRWVTVAQGAESKYPEPPSGQRLTVRVTCVGDRGTGFQSLVQVIIDGRIKQDLSPPTNLACLPPGSG